MADSKIGVVFFGDSVSVGDGVPVHETWVHRVSESLCNAFPGRVMTRNSSVSGETTRQALMRMDYHIGHGSDPKPKILVVQFGLNDSNCWKNDYDGCRVSRKAYEANVREILERALSPNYGFDRILVLKNHIPAKNHPYLADEVCARNNIINNICIPNARVSSVKIPCEKYRPGVADVDLEILLEDGVHLSLLGHTQYFFVVYDVLWNLVDELLIKERGL